MIMAMDAVDLVVKGAAHDEPHDEFDAFRAGLAQVFDMLQGNGRGRIGWAWKMLFDPS